MEKLEEVIAARLAALTHGIKTPLGVARRLQKAGCFGPRQTSMRCPLQRWIVTDPAIQALLPEGASVSVGADVAYAFFLYDAQLHNLRIALNDLLQGFLVEFDVNRKFDFLLPPAAE